MHIFRNMEQPDSGDYRSIPGYQDLTSADQQRVDATYSSVYAQRESMGYKIASGIAYETAKLAIREAVDTPYKGSWADQEAQRRKDHPGQLHPLAPKDHSTKLPGVYDRHGKKISECEDETDDAEINEADREHEIYNHKTGDTLGRKFPNKADAHGFVKQLQSNTAMKLHWKARPVKEGILDTVKKAGTAVANKIIPSRRKTQKLIKRVMGEGEDMSADEWNKIMAGVKAKHGINTDKHLAKKTDQVRTVTKKDPNVKGGTKTNVVGVVRESEAVDPMIASAAGYITNQIENNGGRLVESADSEHNTSAYGYKEHPAHKQLHAAGFKLKHSNHDEGQHTHWYEKGHHVATGTSPQPQSHHGIVLHHQDDNAVKPNWSHTGTPKGHVFGRDKYDQTRGKGHKSLIAHAKSLGEAKDFFDGGIYEATENKPGGSTHKTLSAAGWNHTGSTGQKGGSRVHRYEHPDHGHMSTVHGDGKTEWFYRNHSAKQNTHNGEVKHLSNFVGAVQKHHDKKAK